MDEDEDDDGRETISDEEWDKFSGKDCRLIKTILAKDADATKLFTDQPRLTMKSSFTDMRKLSVPTFEKV